MKVGINLHLHTSDERVDKIDYSFDEALDKSKSLGIDIVALTCHDFFIDKEEYKEAASARKMLFIPGIEKTVEGAHVLVLNCDKEIEKINTLVELREYKKSHPDIFIIAAHPYLPVYSLGKKLLKYGDIFDAVEMTWFYGKIVNLNKKARRDAEILNLPFIATSDAHDIENIKLGYSIIDVPELTIESVFKSIRERAFENVNEPKSFFAMSWYVVLSLLGIR